jgi:chromosome segregation protein
LDRASSEHAQQSGGDSGLEARIEQLTFTLAEKRELLAEVKDRLEQSNAKLQGALDRIKFLHKAGDEKNSETLSLALEIEKCSSELGHLIQNLEEKYGAGCLERPVTSPIQEEMTEPVVTAEMTAEEELALGEEVERLRERIRRLGEVNVMAIEEYEELKKRYDYLITERQDLERSIENLQEAIEYINKTSEERFRKAFEAIADRFERLFPIIFGGGQAKLSLVYPEGSTDILEAGVDILAQPPGKKIVNITLLSGGEKALTAVSLIFAIFMVKPSPFCVLDEVDAPLDDANIGKFNGLLREMSSKSQFIIITHNKKTMELNDVLYGVTMEEPGVSKMVSVQLN